MVVLLLANGFIHPDASPFLVKPGYIFCGHLGKILVEGYSKEQERNEEEMDYEEEQKEMDIDDEEMVGGEDCLCDICKSVIEPNDLLCCSSLCNHQYHYLCFGKTEVPDSTWYCDVCNPNFMVEDDGDDSPLCMDCALGTAMKVTWFNVGSVRTMITRNVWKLFPLMKTVSFQIGIVPYYLRSMIRFGGVQYTLRTNLKFQLVTLRRQIHYCKLDWNSDVGVS